MPMCSWCGAVVSAEAVTELQNGPTVLRLCLDCSDSERGSRLCSTLPRHTRTPDPEEVEDFDGASRPARTWLVMTALVVLAAFLLPLLLSILLR